MRKCLLKSTGLFFLCCLFASLSAQNAPKEKVSVYFLDEEYSDGFNITAISPNGKYAVGHSEDLTHTAFIWDKETRKARPITGSGEDQALVYGVTNEGMVVGAFMDLTKSPTDGRTGCPVPGYWKEGEWTALPLRKGTTLSGSWLDGSALTVSADGTQICGSIQYRYGQYTPAIWKEGVLQDLEYEGVDQGQGGLCLAASSDLNVLGGWSEHENGSRGPAVWSNKIMTRPLGEDPDAEYFFDGQVRGVSSNGKYAVGYFSQDGTGFDAYPFIWSEETGTVKYADSGLAAIVSDAGSVYGASAYMGDGTVYKGGITYDLADYLEENYDFNPDTLKFSLGTVMSVTPDEKMIGGWSIVGNIGGMPLMAPYIVVIEPAASSIESNPAAEISVRLTPNPVIDRLSIEGEFESAALYNSVGAEIVSGIRTASVDMSAFAPGVYFVKVVNGSSGKTFKIMKN